MRLTYTPGGGACLKLALCTCPYLAIGFRLTPQRVMALSLTIQAEADAFVKKGYLAVCMSTWCGDQDVDWRSSRERKRCGNPWSSHD